jgi:[ribosomal protein S5]-alanine N-acetyltransferase
MNNIYDVFISGEKVDLIALSEDIIDSTNWYRWFNDGESTRLMQKHYYPNTLNLQKIYFRENIEGNASKLQLGIFHKEDQLMIGIISLNEIDYINRKCELSGIIGEKKYRNMTYLMEACKLIISHAFNQLNMRKIYGGTMIKELSMLLCRALKFKEEGVRRKDVYKNNDYNDVYLVGLLKDEFYKDVRNS